MAKWKDKGWRYTPVSQQGEGYLARRFRQIRAEEKRREEERNAKVTKLRGALK